MGHDKLIVLGSITRLKSDQASKSFNHDNSLARLHRLYKSLLVVDLISQ